MAPLDPSQVPGLIRRINRAVYRGTVAGIRRGAFAGKRHLVPKTPVDRGDLRRSWRVIRGATPTRGGDAIPAQLANDAPHAGIIEGGARPHSVSREGRDSLLRWVRAHFPGESETGQRRIVWGIVKKLKREGQKPTWFIRDSLDDLARLASIEVQKQLMRVAARKPRPAGGG